MNCSGYLLAAAGNEPLILPWWAQCFDAFGPTVLAALTLILILTQGKENKRHLERERCRLESLDLERQVEAVLRNGQDPTIVILHHLLNDLPLRWIQQAVVVAAVSNGYDWSDALSKKEIWCSKAIEMYLKVTKDT